MNNLDLMQELAERVNEEMLERCDILLSGVEILQRETEDLLRKIEAMERAY